MHGSPLKMKKVIATHTIQADNRHTYEVMEIKEFISNQPLRGVTKWIPATKRLELSDGSAVLFIDDDTIEIVSTGKILRRT